RARCHIAKEFAAIGQSEFLLFFGQCPVGRLSEGLHQELASYCAARRPETRFGEGAGNVRRGSKRQASRQSQEIFARMSENLQAIRRCK
ncbi:MAG: hypothetical protein WA853_06795, partial [Candidatus Acidiferrum sp.]